MRRSDPTFASDDNQFDSQNPLLPLQRCHASAPAAAASAVRPISSLPECARRSGARLGSGAYAGPGPARPEEALDAAAAAARRPTPDAASRRGFKWCASLMSIVSRLRAGGLLAVGLSWGGLLGGGLSCDGMAGA